VSFALLERRPPELVKEQREPSAVDAFAVMLPLPDRQQPLQKRPRWRLLGLDTLGRPSLLAVDDRVDERR
jgi:hypothetical protein